MRQGSGSWYPLFLSWCHCCFQHVIGPSAKLVLTRITDLAHPLVCDKGLQDVSNLDLDQTLLNFFLM
eukprot:9138916-Ditylum_brightwellii.AAC.1